MTADTSDPTTGPGSTSDPNQADRTGFPWPDKHKDVPDTSDGPKQTNPDPETGPGTTRDPNQKERS